MPSETIRILIIDNSAQKRLTLRSIFEQTSNMVVMGEVRCSNAAVREAQKLKPDIIIIGIDMPDMNGCEITGQILESLPVPILIMSDSSDSDIQFKVLKAGALDLVLTPDIQDKTTFEQRKAALINAILCMSEVKVVARRMDKFFKNYRSLNGKNEHTGNTSNPHTKHIVAIGVSTGGPPLIASILCNIKADFKHPICIVQHISEHFTDSMISWLSTQSVLPVSRIVQEMRVQNSCVYIAPGGINTIITPDGYFKLITPTSSSKPTPSVNEFFLSVSESYGQNSTAILLTGMGNDGAEGLKVLHDCGACTIIEDKESCIVYGMPDAAKKLDAAKFEMTPQQIIDYLNSL